MIEWSILSDTAIFYISALLAVLIGHLQFHICRKSGKILSKLAIPAAILLMFALVLLLLLPSSGTWGALLIGFDAIFFGEMLFADLLGWLAYLIGKTVNATQKQRSGTP
ncbi:MAG: hypothetical protein ACI3YK_00370 [Eubacteriales bacterium]